jgi:NAD(P)-dependent dehydrogenase (short-subunit alcohol dehydrogenase family)
MGMRIHDSVVVITGASSGVGRACASVFAARGGAVVLASRREHALEEVARACRKHRGARVLVVPTDVSDPNAVARLARQAVGTFGRIDVWINSAAPSPRSVPSGTSRPMSSAGCWTSMSWGTCTGRAPPSPSCASRAAVR